MSTTVLIKGVSEAPPEELLPRIPGYVVLRLLGRGGMGRVYLGRDLQMGREVAIKTLHAGAEPEIAARFREEVSAVAAIRHPNVLQVYHAGEADGRPFLVMEYVAGGTLAQFIAGKPKLPREAASVIEPIARAIQHCHEHGILHRDLKPSNILVAASDQPTAASQSTARLTADRSTLTAQPKVADFGLAKRLGESAGLTKTGDVLGTPAYMAPEQASGVVSQLGPATDIYSLGAILYELLTGRPPFSSPDPVQTIMMVLSMDPIPPRNLQPKLPRDLDTIALKCLEKTPRKRYETAGELADDLRRFLDGHAIHARATRIWEKGIKWAKRRPAWAALGVVIVLAVIALGVAFGIVQQKNADLNETNSALKIAQQKRAETIIISLQAVNRMLIELSDELANVPQAVEVRRRVLADAEGLCRAVIRENPSDPLGRQYVAQAQQYLGNVLAMQGQSTAAETEYRHAIDGFGSLAAEAPTNASYHKELLATWNQIGKLFDGRQETQEAIAAYENALAEGNRVTDDPEAMRLLGRVRNNLAVSFLRAGYVDRAEAEHRRNLIDRKQAYEQHPDDADAIGDLAATRLNLGSLLTKREKWEEALDQMTSAERLYSNLKSPRPADRASLGKARLNIGQIAARLHRSDVEAKAYADAAGTLAALAGDFASVPDYRYLSAYAKMQLFRMRVREDKFDEANEAIRGARDILAALNREFPDNAEYKAQLEFCRQALGENPPKK
jgi:eukaryotic-like serine/threonine-protein kinase